MEKGRVVGAVEGTQEHDEEPWWANPDRQARVLQDNRRIRDNDIKPLLALRSMLVGPHFGGGLEDTSKEKPTNTVYGFYSRVMSQVMGGELTCMIDADVGSPEEPIALAYERGINKTFEQAHGTEIAEMVLADMVCGYGALLVTPPEESSLTLRDAEREGLNNPLGAKRWDDHEIEPRLEQNEAGELVTVSTPMQDASPRMPGLMYLGPKYWSYDRRAYTFAEAEFFEYQTSHDLNELIEKAKGEEDGWDLEMLRHARTEMDSEANRTGGKVNHQGTFETDRERDRIMLTSLMVMHAKIEDVDPPENHNAVMYTLWSATGEVESSHWVREPYYVFVPPWGPFVHFYQHMIGEDSLAFSVLTANKTKVESADDIHAVAFKRIREYKSNPVFDVRDAADIEALESAPDGKPVAITGENGLKYENVIRGGLDPVIVNAIQYFDARLAEDLGFSSAERGAAIGGNITATETGVAANQANMRVLQFQRAFNRAMAGVYRAIGWYIGHDSRFVVRADFSARAAFHEQEARPLVGNMDAAEIGRRAAGDQESQGLIQGGDFSETEDFDFNELRFDVNAQLQQAIMPEQRRMESAQLRMEIVQLMQAAVQLPVYDWVSELRRLEIDYGRRGLVDKFRSEIAMLIAGVNVEGGQTEARMSSDMTGNQSGPTMARQNTQPMAQSEAMSRGASRGQAATQQAPTQGTQMPNAM